MKQQTVTNCSGETYAIGDRVIDRYGDDRAGKIVDIIWPNRNSIMPVLLTIELDTGGRVHEAMGKWISIGAVE